MANLIHINGHIMTKNKNENDPILVFNPVRCDGQMPGIVGDFLRSLDSNAFGLYQTKCDLIANHIGERGDNQCICLLADFGYMLNNAFVFYNNADPAVDAEALIHALENARQFYPTYTFRIPYKFAVDLTDSEWQAITIIIVNQLVNNGINVEIWHNTN